MMMMRAGCISKPWGEVPFSWHSDWALVFGVMVRKGRAQAALSTIGNHSELVGRTQ